MRVDRLFNHFEDIEKLATAHYNLWGRLTGCNSIEQYKDLLCNEGKGSDLLATLTAIDNDIILGSVNIVKNDLPIQEELTPWLAQLYVFPKSRNKGVGALLVKAAFEAVKGLNFPMFYLYTSGTLPEFYESLGWRRKQVLEYLGVPRVVMEIKTIA